MTTGPGQGDPGDPGRRASSVPRPAGLVLSPFRALRFDPDVAGGLPGLTSPPYDVLDPEAVDELEQASPWNVVRLILPRDDPDSGRDRYAVAAARLDDWRERDVLRADDVPALYVYEMAETGDGPGRHVQRGLLGALALTPAEDEIVLPHESTMAGPVADRLALYSAVGADLEPIFLVYDGGGAASAAVAAADQSAALVDDVLEDGLRHRLWAITDPGDLAAIAQDLAPRTALIADGHHRYATYLRRQDDRHAAGDGPGPWDSGLCLLVDATAFGPQVHPIHRVVPGRPIGDLAAAAEQVATVTPVPGGVDDALRLLEQSDADRAAFVLSDGDTHVLLSDLEPAAVDAALPADRSAAWRALDVTVLHRYVVPVVWQLGDDEELVGFEHDVDSALRAAKAAAGTAVLLRPTPVDAVAAVAAAGDRMPRKSTLFTPKPRSGVVLRDHRDA